MDKILDSLDGVPEHFHQFYEKDEKQGGKFVLQDIGPLKNALTHAKNERAEARKKAEAAAAWEKLGKTPEEVAELLAAKTKEEEEAAKKAGNFDQVLEQHKSKWQKDLDAAAAERDTWRNQFVNAHVNNNLTQALVKGETTPEGAELLPNILKDRVSVEVKDGKVSTRITNPDGSPMIGNGENGMATFDDLVADAKKKYPSLFKGSGQSGSGAPGNTNGNGGGAPGNLKRSKMSIPEKAKYIEEHGQAAYLKLPM